MSLELEEILMVIRLRTVCNWLCKLKYEHKDVCKDVFVDGHEQSDVVEDWGAFY